MSKIPIARLAKFDVNQKIIESLSGVCSRAILFSIRDGTKDASQIADELDISPSTVYRTLSKLEDLALVEVDQFIISSEGKKIKKYKSRVRRVEIDMDGMEPVLKLYPNMSLDQD